MLLREETIAFRFFVSKKALTCYVRTWASNCARRGDADANTTRRFRNSERNGRFSGGNGGGASDGG